MKLTQSKRKQVYSTQRDTTLICARCGYQNFDGIKFFFGLCRNCYETEHRNNNPEIRKKINQRNTEYRLKNKDKRRAYENKRLRSNPAAKLANRFRNWVNKLITRKSGNAESLVGCSYKELKIHLESEFLPSMSWDNWALDGWHIDHIKPLALFDLTDPHQQRLAFHYTNMRPLWAKDNLSKGSKYPGGTA
jgi:hypothetical protein